MTEIGVIIISELALETDSHMIYVGNRCRYLGPTILALLSSIRQFLFRDVELSTYENFKVTLATPIFPDQGNPMVKYIALEAPRSEAES